MFAPIVVVYLVIKGAFLAGMIKAFTSSDRLHHRPILMGAIYTAGVAALSYIYLNPSMLRAMDVAGMQDRRVWLGTTFLLSSTYFWLLARFEDAGGLWWSILILGLGLVIY